MTILVALVGTAGYAVTGIGSAQERVRSFEVAQQSVMVGLHRISRELRETSVTEIDFSPGDDEADVQGIRFPVPREDGQAVVADGAPDWKSWITYFVEKADGDAVPTLYRVEISGKNQPTWKQVSKGSRVRIASWIAPAGTVVPYGGTLAEDPDDEGGTYLATSCEVSGGEIVLKTDGFSATQLDDGTVRIGITAASPSIGQKRRANGEYVQRMNVVSNFTEVMPRNQ